MDDCVIGCCVAVLEKRLHLHVAKVPLAEGAVETDARHLEFVPRVDQRSLDLIGMGDIRGENGAFSPDVKLDYLAVL